MKIVSLEKWKNFVPINEAGEGKGREYGYTVKIKKVDNGGALITERDGDQREFKPGGATINVTTTPKLGLKTLPPTQNAQYDAAEGDEQVFFGRGYVQLTWWANYATAGVEIAVAVMATLGVVAKAIAGNCVPGRSGATLAVPTWTASSWKRASVSMT